MNEGVISPNEVSFRDTFRIIRNIPRAIARKAKEIWEKFKLKLEAKRQANIKKEEERKKRKEYKRQHSKIRRFFAYILNSRKKKKKEKKAENNEENIVNNQENITDLENPIVVEDEPVEEPSKVEEIPEPTYTSRKHTPFNAPEQYSNRNAKVEPLPKTEIIKPRNISKPILVTDSTPVNVANEQVPNLPKNDLVEAKKEETKNSNEINNNEPILVTSSEPAKGEDEKQNMETANIVYPQIVTDERELAFPSKALPKEEIPAEEPFVERVKEVKKPLKAKVRVVKKQTISFNLNSSLPPIVELERKYGNITDVSLSEDLKNNQRLVLTFKKRIK